MKETNRKLRIIGEGSRDSLFLIYTHYLFCIKLSLIRYIVIPNKMKTSFSFCLFFYQAPQNTGTVPSII